MPILLDHQLRELIPHKVTEFPVTFYHDELFELPDWEGPFHWHPDFEIATAASGTLDYQVGQQHVMLEAGDSILVNGNMLHRIRQVSGDSPDLMPNVVFSGSVIAPEYSTIYQKYIQPFAQCNSLPFIVFRHQNSFHSEVNRLIRDIYKYLSEQKQCYEMIVQRNISSIFEYIFCNIDSFPKNEIARIRLKIRYDSKKCSLTSMSIILKRSHSKIFLMLLISAGVKQDVALIRIWDVLRLRHLSNIDFKTHTDC